MKTKTCQCCNKEFAQYQKVNGKMQSLFTRKFCLDCSPFGTSDRRHPKDRPPIVEGHKQCSLCKEMRPLNEFPMRNKKYLHCECRKCGSARICHAMKEQKLKAVTYKGGKCIHCGYSKCVGSLHFHHLDPKQKDFNISSGKYIAWHKMQTELDKCVLLCANCHGEFHAGLITL